MRCLKTLVAIPVFFLFCNLPAPVDSDYYQNYDRILGGRPPAVPVLNYDPQELRFSWNQSIDPDTGNPATSYVFYRYLNEVPDDLFHSRFRYLVVPGENLQAQFEAPITQKGLHIFGLTSFDSQRESGMSNFIFIQVN